MQLRACQARPAAAPHVWLPLHGPRCVAAFRRQHPAGARRPGGPAARVGAAAATARQLAVAASASTQPGSGDDIPVSCPLHACLWEYGITDLAPFSGCNHLAMTQSAVDTDVRPKLADLAAEGLQPADMAALLATKSSPLWCSYAGVFQPNLALLRDILRHCDEVPHPSRAHLSVVGRRLVSGPTLGARALGRDPGKIAQLLGWAERELGVSRAELSQSLGIFQVLYLSRSAGEAVRQLLMTEFGWGRAIVARITTCNLIVASMFVACPQMFRLKPALLVEKVSFLQRELGVDFARAVGLIEREPRLLWRDLEAGLPPVLAFLDTYMGEAGAGRRLVVEDPILATTTCARAEREIAALGRLGFDQDAIRMMIAEHPNVLARNVGSAAQQQKREWFEQVSPWGVGTLNASPRLRSASLRRLASRLDFMLSHGLHPYSPEPLACMSDATFLQQVARKHKRATGHDLRVTDWGAWEAAWLQTAAGRRWGFPPLG